MPRPYKPALLLAFLLLLPACSRGAETAVPPVIQPQPEATPQATARANQSDTAIASTLAGLSLEEKIGQLVMVSSNATLSIDGIQRLISDDHAGNLVLIRDDTKSPAQLRDQNAALQQLARANNHGVPLLIGIDQEGGDVSSLQKGFTVFPNPMALGATGSAVLARQEARAMGEEMRAVGVNLDLAPVLDLNTNPDNPVIGLRSLGDNPTTVSNLGTAIISGLHDAGLLATAKHFPGHGATSQDSHLTLPTVSKSRAALEQQDMAPFAAAVHAGVDAVLVAHVSYPALDPSGLPASLSQPVVTGVLRQQLGFDGVVITDDLGMGAITSRFSLGEAAVRAIEAGDDLLILTTPPDEIAVVLAALRNAVAGGRISEQRLDASVTRILRLKARIAAPGNLNAVASPTNAAVAVAVSEQAVTAVAGDPAPLRAITGSGRRLLVVSPADLLQSGAATNGGTELGAAVRRRYSITDEVIVNGQTGAGRVAALAAAPSAGAVVVATTGESVAEDQFIRSLLAANSHTTVLLLGLPYELRGFSSAPSVLATYGQLPVQIEAAVAVLFGEKAASGRLPVQIKMS